MEGSSSYTKMICETDDPCMVEEMIQVVIK